MFQDQAARLTREDLTVEALAQEIQSMFGDNVPLSHDAPITLNKTNENAPGLTIQNRAGGSSLAVNGGTVTFDGAEFIRIGATGTPIEIQGKPYPPTSDSSTSSTSGTTVFLGRVVSGSGNSYQVDLYGNGSQRAATDTVVATVPDGGIDSRETIPPDTWLQAVYQFTNAGVTTYEFQPTVWM